MVIERRDHPIKVDSPTGPIVAFVSSAAVAKAWGPFDSDVGMDERVRLMTAQFCRRILELRTAGRIEEDGSIFLRAIDVEATSSAG